MLAKDGGTPSRTATTIVTIDVDRNLNSPRFSPDNVRVAIPETLAAGSLVTAVTASDDDTQVSIGLKVPRKSGESYVFVNNPLKFTILCN